MINSIARTIPSFLQRSLQPHFKPLPLNKFTPNFSKQMGNWQKPYQWRPIAPQTSKIALTKPIINYPRWLFTARFNHSYFLTQKLFTLPTGSHLFNLNLFTIFNYKSIDQVNEARKTHKIKMDATLKKEPEFRTCEEKIELFNYLLECGEEEIQKANGKDIVIVFGKTGSGKSTLINYLYGCTMIKDDDDNIVVSPDSKIKEIAPIGIELSSCTYIPKQIPDIIVSSRIKLSTNNDPETTDAYETLTLYDMPGLDDNRGVEVALANAIVIKELTKRARSVRFVMAFEHGLITGEKANAWKESVELVIDAFNGAVGRKPNSLCLVVTKPASGIETIIKQIRKCVGPNGTSVDLSPHATICDLLNPSERDSLLDLIYEKTPFQGLSANVSIGPAQLSKATDLGKEVQRMVKEHLQTGTEVELTSAAKKIQFTSGLAKLGNRKLKRTHKEATEAVCDYVESLLLQMTPERDSKLVTRQIVSFENYCHIRTLFNRYINFKKFEARLHELKDRTGDPRWIAWNEPETTIASAGITALCCAGIVAGSAAAAPIVIVGGVVGATVGTIATAKGIWNWMVPSEKDKKITNFFKSL